MRISKIIVALLASVVAVAAMTGVAVADPEKVMWYADGTSTPLPPLVLINDGFTNNDFDLEFYDYWSGSVASQSHTLILTITPATPGAAASDINVTITERSGGVTNTGVGTATITWLQDAAGTPPVTIGSGDFMDVTLVSNGPDGAKYQINLDDVGYNVSGVKDFVIENHEAANVPEFATIAIPAIAVLGLFLFFNKRKHKKD
jgi:hypothetical protein